MKNILLVFSFFMCAVYVILAEEEECVGRACTLEYRPVCGMRLVDGKLEKKVFGNYCMFQAANDCGGGYQQCELSPEEQERPDESKNKKCVHVCHSVCL